MYFIPYDVILHSMYICKKWDFNKIFESWILNNKVRSQLTDMIVVYGHSSVSICGGAMRSYRKSRDRKWHQSRDRKWRQSRVMSGSMFCACATGSCVISTLVGPFDRKCQSHVTGRGPVWKWPLPEVCSAHARFSPHFFLCSSTVVTWLPDVSTLYYYSRY
jgi:hypothetical protein